jgi:hypothetical protein
MAQEPQDRIAKEGTGRHHVSAEATQTFEGEVHCEQGHGNVQATSDATDVEPDQESECQT